MHHLWLWLEPTKRPAGKHTVRHTPTQTKHLLGHRCYRIVSSSHFFYFYSSQAQARCHRIGQNKAVKVYRLITRNSYEREMFDRASLKLGLDKAVLQSMSGRDNSLGGGAGGGVSLPSVSLKLLYKYWSHQSHSLFFSVQVSPEID